MPSSSLKALITAGGTREPIDDVRVITNLSKGRFGTIIARELVRQGVETTLLCSHEAAEAVAVEDDLRVERFSSFADLREKMEELVPRFEPDLLFMAAAVSDYSPVRTIGKIDSSAEELSITLRRNIKLLSQLRALCGVETFIAGFKLTSGLSNDEIYQLALRQVLDNRINLTVANDLKRLDKLRNLHPIMMVTPEGGALHVIKSREEVAVELVQFVLQRQNVRWFKTETAPRLSSVDTERRNMAAELLRFAQEALLLSGSPGNVSVRALAGTESEQSLVITPRGVDKSELSAEELLDVTVNLNERRVLCDQRGALRSSIDTGVQALIYRELPDVTALLHFHAGKSLVLTQSCTTFPYPCGTVEEATEIIAAVEATPLKVLEPAQGFCVELVHHGYLMGFAAGQVEALTRRWKQLTAQYALHLEEVGEPGMLPQLRLHPIFNHNFLVGVLAEGPLGSSIFIAPDSRRAGLGDKLVTKLIERGDTVVAHDLCEVKDFYVARGYSSEQQGQFFVLTPPTRRSDLIAAASVCLFYPPTREVLLGERLVEPWKGFYAFPGGKVETGDADLLSAAVREFNEEAGIQLQGVGAEREVSIYVGCLDNSRAYHVSNFLVLAEQRMQPQPSEEMACRWIELGEALKLKLGIGTRRVLRELHDSFLAS